MSDSTASPSSLPDLARPGQSSAATNTLFGVASTSTRIRMAAMDRVSPGELPEPVMVGLLRGPLRAQVLERLACVGLAGRMLGVEVVLVQLDRLVTAAAQLPERLGTREHDRRPVRELARARELVVRVGVVAGVEQLRALVDDGLADLDVLLGLAGPLGRRQLVDRVVGIGVPDAVLGLEVRAVEGDRLLPMAAQLAQGLRAREQDPGAVGELAGP